MTTFILKRAPIGPNQEDYDVLADDPVVGRIFLSPTLDYQPTRKAAMAAFAKSWRRE